MLTKDKYNLTSFIQLATMNNKITFKTTSIKFKLKTKKTKIKSKSTSKAQPNKLSQTMPKTTKPPTSLNTTSKPQRNPNKITSNTLNKHINGNNN